MATRTSDTDEQDPPRAREILLTPEGDLRPEAIVEYTVAGFGALIARVGRFRIHILNFQPRYVEVVEGTD
jgi:hypothetical protein